MKRLATLLFLFFSLLSFAQEATFLSYNVRYATKNDELNQWDFRKEDLSDLIKEVDPLAFGVQEAIHKQMKFLQERLPEYAFVGQARDDGRTEGEYSAIFYKKDELELICDYTFWLSETPDSVSKGWDAALPRICTLAHFRIKGTNKEFYIFNTHFDHKGSKARINSAKLIVDKIKMLNSRKIPIILTGDFNATPNQRPIQEITKLLDDASVVAEKGIIGPIGTFNGFNTNAFLDSRIDYIFTYRVEVNAYAHLENRRPNGLWPSDHLPVMVSVSFDD